MKIQNPAVRAFTSYVSQFKAGFIVTGIVFALADIATSSIPWLIGRLTSSLSNASGQLVLWTTLVILASVGHHILWTIADLLYLKFLVGRGIQFDDTVFAAIVTATSLTSSPARSVATPTRWAATFASFWTTASTHTST